MRRRWAGVVATLLALTVLLPLATKSAHATTASPASIVRPRVFQMHHFPLPKGPADAGRVSPAAATLAGYIPCDLYNAYYLNGFSQTGAGVSIAVITAWDQPNIASDLGTFDAMFGLPGPPSFTIHAMGPFASTDAATRDGW